MKDRYRTVFFSDVHLGSPQQQSERFYEFITSFHCDTMFIVGDFIDGWSLKRKFLWGDTNNNIIRHLIKKARQTRIVYLAGNHDQFIKHFNNYHFGNIEIAKESEFVTADRKVYLVLHGDIFDRHHQFFSIMGSKLYDLSFAISRIVKFKLSTHLKNFARSLSIAIDRFPDAATKHASSRGYDGVITGHTHIASNRMIDQFHYLNCGDAVESFTAIVEHYDGRLELVQW